MASQPTSTSPASSSSSSSSTSSTSAAAAAAPSVTATQNAQSIAHTVALGAVVATPVLLLMPPRKLDLYTFAVVGCGVYGGNHLVRERYGVGMLGLAGQRLNLVPSSSDTSSTSSSSSSSASSPSSSSSSYSSAVDHSRPGHESAIERFSLPTERARSLHEALAADKTAAERRRAAYGELRARAAGLARDGWGVGGDVARGLELARAAVEADARRHGWPVPRSEGQDGKGNKEHRLRKQVLTSAVEASGPWSLRDAEDEVGEEEEREGGGVAGMVKKVWMGDQPADWKERRMKEEQEALDQGKGYGDMIMDQIWEVWNWDKKKTEDGEWVPKDSSQSR